MDWSKLGKNMRFRKPRFYQNTYYLEEMEKILRSFSSPGRQSSLVNCDLVMWTELKREQSIVRFYYVLLEENEILETLNLKLIGRKGGIVMGYSDISPKSQIFLISLRAVTYPSTKKSLGNSQELYFQTF